MSNLEPQLSYHIRHYVPDADGESLENRIALLKARDWAAALRGQAVCYLAQDLSFTAHEIAGHFVFAKGEPPSRLSMATNLCRRLAGAAMAADGLAATDDAGRHPTLGVLGGDL